MMVRKTFGVLFYFKKPKQKTTVNLPLYMRITVDGRRAELSIKRQWNPDKWNAPAGRATGTKEDARALNAYLDTLKARLYEAQRHLLSICEEVTAEKLKQQLCGVAERPRMILEIFQQHNDQMKELVGSQFAPLTFQRYCTALEHTRAFIHWKYARSDFEVSKLSFEFMHDFEFYLKSVRKCGHNTTMKYLANFKKIVLLCVKKGWLQKDPFFGFHIAPKEVVRQFLSQQELDALAAKQFGAERLNIVRDIFLFSCYTGLAYVDVHKLRRSEIITGMDGHQWIFTSRQKTEVPSRIPLLPVCLEILQRYEQHPQCLGKDRVLPVWSNQKLNEYLKEIADVCGIKKRLTYHIARHTFATTVTLNNGVPIETVAKMLGHRSLKTTQHYAKILDKKISEDMQTLRQKLGGETSAKRIQHL